MIHLRSLLTCIAVLAIAMPTTAMAGTLTLSIVPVSQNVVRGGSGYVVDFTLTTTDSVGLSGFNISLKTDPLAGVSFTGGDASVTNYVFAGNSIGLLFTTPDGANTADINDSPDNPPVTIVGPGIYGLGEIFFSIAGNAPLGIINVTLDSSTSFTDRNGSPITFVPDTNTTIGTVTVVPEPSSLVMGAIGIATGLVSLAKRQRSYDKT